MLLFRILKLVMILTAFSNSAGQATNFTKNRNQHRNLLLSFHKLYQIAL